MNDAPPRPGNLTYDRVIDRAANEAGDILARIVNEMFAVKETGDWAKIDRMLRQMISLDADTRSAGAILGMLSPWLPAVRPLVEGAPPALRALQMDIKGLDDILPGPFDDGDYRWPTLAKAIDWIVSQKIADLPGLKALHIALKRRATLDGAPSIRRMLERIQEALAESIRDGDSAFTFRKRLSQITNLTKQQSDTLFRTNTKRAFMHGMNESAKNPRVRNRFNWVFFEATDDDRVRPWHWSFDGWVAEIGTQLYWLMMQVQGEWNCRCGMFLADKSVVDRFGLKTMKDVKDETLKQIELKNYAGDRGPKGTL